MRKKIRLLIRWVVLTIASGGIICFFEKNGVVLGVAIISSLIGIFIERIFKAFQDILDITNWKTSQTKLKRGNFIKDDTVIRISFSFLFRIKVSDKYLLVQNSRNTGKYQPVGGVYKFHSEELMVLKNLFHVMDDNKILVDESSKNDYRLRMESRYLRKFMQRFDSRKAKRERIDNVGREFKEELIDTDILTWDKISYRYCGRHITDLKFGDHFQIYELLLFDVVELLPTSSQEQELKKLMNTEHTKYQFATGEQIACLGMDTKTGKLYEWIGDHTKYILQESESNLIKMQGTGQIYTVDL